MRHYEITFLVHPDQSEQVPAMIDRYKNMVTSGQGSIHRVENWGRRRLAYMINDVYKAHYVMLNIECNLNVLGEIENNFKFNDSILRYLVIRRKEAITEESVIAKEKQRENALEAVEAERQLKSAVPSDDGSGKESKSDEVQSDEVQPDDGSDKESESDEVQSDEVQPDGGSDKESESDEVLTKSEEMPAESDVSSEAVLDEAVLDEYALEEDALEDEAIKDAALKDGGIV